MNKIIIGTLVALVVLVGIASAGTVHNINKGTDYITIQAAIDDANIGDEIHVDSGTYYENVQISKKLILIGIDTGDGNPMVDAHGGPNAFWFFADSVTLENFDIINSNDHGIRVDFHNNSNIINNTISKNHAGIFLYESSNNNIIGNTFSYNNFSIAINTANENNVKKNRLSNNLVGIYIVESDNNNIIDNYITKNNNGIFTWLRSNNNIMAHNVVVDNNIGIGFYQPDVSMNKVYNNFFNNTMDISSDSNIWNTTKMSGVNIIGGYYIGGNFWANPSGTGFSQQCTNRGDGFCDSNYMLDSNNVDYLPLTNNPVPNQLPIAEAGGPYTVDEGNSIMLDGSASSDPDGDQLTYAWDLNNDGIYETSGMSTTMTSEDGPVEITVGLQVSDGRGGISTDITTITVNNVNPVVGPIAINPPEPTVDIEIIATSSISDKGILDTHTATWNWGDGTTSTGTISSGIASGNHKYTNSGTYHVILTVIDNNGGTGTSETGIIYTVDNISPVITLNGENPVKLYIGSAYADLGATAMDNIDGPVPVTTTGSADTDTIGTYTITYTATDSSGNSAFLTRTVKVIYNFTGFFQPIDNLPTWNSIKAGNAVPVKLSLNGNQGLDIFMLGYPASQNIGCDSSVPIDPVEETVAAGSSSLSYNIATDQYSYIWKTNKAWKNSCRQLIILLKDGTYHNASFNLK